MRCSWWTLPVAAALVALPGQRALAQQGAVELGIDGEIVYHVVSGEPDGFQFSMPLAHGDAIPRAHNGFRVGYFVTDQVELEPSISFDYLHIQGQDGGAGNTSWNLGFATSLLYHFTPDASRARPFVGVGANVTAVDFGSGSDTNSQFGVSGEVGVKVPLVSRLAARLSGGAGHFFENNDAVGRTAIFGAFGFSWFTR